MIPLHPDQMGEEGWPKESKQVVKKMAILLLGTFQSGEALVVAGPNSQVVDIINDMVSRLAADDPRIPLHPDQMKAENGPIEPLLARESKRIVKKMTFLAPAES